MSRWQRLLCWISPWYSRRMLERFALEYMRRNLQTALDREGLPFVAVINPKSSIKPPPSSWTDRLSRPAIEKAESRRGTADMEAPAPTDTVEDFTQRQVRAFASETGEDGRSRYERWAARSGSSSSTGAPVPPDSSTSTPTPSHVSRRSVADSSGSR